MPDTMALAERLEDFYGSIRMPVSLPTGISAMNPYAEPVTREYSSVFFRKYYDDCQPRTLLIGINPGRFGAGVTGVMFTDPVRLESHCGIANDLPKRQELSSVFIYRMIDACGGTAAFYSRHLFSAVCPLGFVKKGKNLNYYDEPGLADALEELMAESVRMHLAMGVHRDRAYVLGMGKNARHMQRLNERYSFFGELVALPHPRWIMQYRLRRMEEFIELYRSCLA